MKKNIKIVLASLLALVMVTLTVSCSMDINGRGAAIEEDNPATGLWLIRNSAGGYVTAEAAEEKPWLGVPSSVIEILPGDVGGIFYTTYVIGADGKWTPIRSVVAKEDNLTSAYYTLGSNYWPDEAHFSYRAGDISDKDGITVVDLIVKIPHKTDSTLPYQDAEFTFSVYGGTSTGTALSAGVYTLRRYN